MRIRFKRDRDFTPADERRITVAYPADAEVTVKRAWGEKLVADGDAEEIEAPARHPLDHDDNGRKGGAHAPID
jgi:hypothetical protein